MVLTVTPDPFMDFPPSDPMFSFRGLADFPHPHALLFLFQSTNPLNSQLGKINDPTFDALVNTGDGRMLTNQELYDPFYYTQNDPFYNDYAQAEQRLVAGADLCVLNSTPDFYLLRPCVGGYVGDFEDALGVTPLVNWARMKIYQSSPPCP